MKFNECTSNEKQAWIQCRAAFNWVVGGYENAVEDNGGTMPSHEQLLKEIYDTVMTSESGEGFQGSNAIKEIRFAGKKFIIDRIENMLKNDGY